MARTEKILVVDDDQPTREFVVEVLEDEGYRVQTAGDAPHALAAFEAERYDVILLDLHMPGVDGANLFRLLTKRGLATMPIVLMTADNHAAHHLIAQGVKFILIKPFDLDTLLNCLAEALRSPKETQAQGSSPPVTEGSSVVPEGVHICA